MHSNAAYIDSAVQRGGGQCEGRRYLHRRKLYFILSARGFFKLMIILRFFMVLLVVLVVGGCSDRGDAPSRVSPLALEPTDPAIAQLYNRSCRSCHARGTAQAPRTGDVDAWAGRLTQGMDVLLEHTINGYNGMPPRGMCFDCSDKQLRALIVFMSSGPQ